MSKAGEKYCKYSRRHGWMELSSFASGDGSISFHWTKHESGSLLLTEMVTESDVAESLRHSVFLADKWKGWAIILLGRGGSGDYREVRLVRPVCRPKNKSKVLVMDNVEYRFKSVDGKFVFTCRGKEVENASDVASLRFFLIYEEDFGRCYE